MLEPRRQQPKPRSGAVGARSLFAILFVMVLPAPVGAQSPPSKAATAPVTPFRSSAFLCIETARGGVKYNEDSRLWEGVAFEAQNKFVVRADLVRQRTVFGKPGERPTIVGADYRITMTGPGPEPRPERHPCAPPSGDTDLVAIVANNEIVCRALSYELVLSVRTSRFVLTNRAGFVDGRDSGANELSVSIGSCTQSSD